jgi:hypothetical protein
MDRLRGDYTNMQDEKTSIHNCMKQFVLEYSLQMPYVDRKMLFEELLSDCKKDTMGICLKQPFFLEPTFAEMREYFAGKKIVRHMVEYISNPSYEQGRKRLKREHNKLI